MKVFISWSGSRSRKIADVFRRWLPGVLQAVRPYFSPDDVAKGSRWEGEISKELAASRVGLLILTPENMEAPWLVFEAGALAKNLEKSRVCPLLFGVDATDLEGPLVQFQAAKFDRAEIFRLVKMVNVELGDQGLESSVLEQVFNMWWPKLEEEIKGIMREDAAPPEKQRSERDMLVEILGLMRRPAIRAPMIGSIPIDDLVGCFTELAKEGEASPELADKIRKLGRPVSYLARRLGGARHAEQLAQAIEMVEALLPKAEVETKDE
jgi:TIR domain